jgi:hypothetical protein
LNHWNYTQSNPINYTDPSGHCISGVVVDTIFCIAVIATGAVIIAGVTSATYNYAVTQGGGIGGFNENNRGCIDMSQVLEAGKGASLGVLATGGETLASLPLTGVYLAAAIVDKKSPAQINIEILHQFGLDDEYIAAMRNPNFVAGKMGGSVATTYLSLRAFFAGLPTFKSTTIPLNVPQINNGVLSLRLVLNLPSIEVVGGSGELIYNGVAGVIPTYSMMSGSGRGGSTNWTFGRNHSATQWANKMEKRGWTYQQIDEAIRNGKTARAINLVHPGNSATRYIHPVTGRSVVVDDVTNEVIHLGGDGFGY